MSKEIIKPCPTKILEDVPSDKDLLYEGEIGPHERVATAISEMISSGNESGGKMVGLEGGWGSGKSTVTKLLSKKLGINTKISFFYFDAWAHEGDPLRRTFLESLIRHFQSHKWVDSDFWNKKLETLANRRKTTSTRTTPKTTTLGRLFAFALLLVPVGAPFLVTSLKDGVTIDRNLPVSWMFLIGIILVTMPFFVLFINQCRVIIKRLRRKSSEDDAPSDWAFLVGNAITEVKQDSIETTEPTSIEFEDIFKEVMLEALKEKDGKQCVIVLDNLDRVDSKYALGIWSTLQTFLQDRSNRNEGWFKRLWLLIPYDPIGLRQLWSSNSNSDKESDFIASSFIDKSFQIRFEVTPLVLSNWKSYMIKLLKEALPQHSEDEDMHNKIFSVYNLGRSDSNQSPTPRELKLFVNQIGSIHRQWEHEFPLGHVAYYSLLKRQRKDVSEALIKGDIPSKVIESMLGANLKANLAGLLFNVKNTIGQQLLLKGPIVNSLSNNGASALKELKQNHGQGFWDVLGVIFSSEVADFEISTFANASSCLRDSQVLEDGPSYEIGSIKETLAKVALSKEKWSLFDKTITHGIDSLCVLVSKKEFTTSLLENVRNALSNLDLTPEAGAKNSEQVYGFIKIFKSCFDLGHDSALSKVFTLPINQNEWLRQCSIIAKEESKLWKLIRPKTSFVDVVTLLASEVTKGEYKEENLSAIKVSNIAYHDEVQWESLINSIVTRLGYAQRAASPEVGILLKALYLLKTFDPKNSTEGLEKLVSSGDLMNALYSINSQGHGHTEAKAMCIFAYLDRRPDASAPQAVSNAIPGHQILMNALTLDDLELAHSLTGILMNHSSISLLLQVIDARGAFDPLIIRCLRIIADSQTSEVLYNYTVILEKWEGLRTHLNEPPSMDRFEKLIRHLCDKAVLVSEILKTPFKIKDCSLYVSISNVSNSNEFYGWCRRGLENLSLEQWSEQLKSEGTGLLLLIQLVKSGIVTVQLKNHFEDALLAHSKEIISSKVPISQALKDQWFVILNGLDAPERKVLAGRLITEAMQVDGAISNEFFEMYGNEISNQESIINHGGIIEKLFSPIVRNQVVGGLKWLKLILSRNTDLLNSFKGKENDINYFKDRIKTILVEKPGGENEAFLLTQEIATILKINLES